MCLRSLCSLVSRHRRFIAAHQFYGTCTGLILGKPTVGQWHGQKTVQHQEGKL